MLAFVLAACGPKPDATTEPPSPQPNAAPAAPEASAAAATSASASSTAGPAVVAGPFQAPPAIPTLERHESCLKPACTVDAALLKPTSGGPPARMWEQQIAKSSTLTVPKTKDSAVLVMVLAGAIEWGKETKDRLSPASTGFKSGTKAAAPPPPTTSTAQDFDGVVFFDGDFSFKSLEGTRVLLAVVDLPEDMRSKKPAPFDSRASSFTLRGGTNLSWADGAMGARIAVEQDPILQRTVASVTFLGIGSPKGVAEHVHENEWEMLAILSGAGTMTVGKGAEAKKVDVRPGSLVAIPKGTPHAFAPSELPVTAIQLYVPPGPEQRFRKLAEGTK
ncbi:MAG: cupin domain-containing protein [Polyangiaceae bacterium]|nr:cupin domain-containing protein [Polyangiaceae bacterium]